MGQLFEWGLFVLPALFCKVTGAVEVFRSSGGRCVLTELCIAALVLHEAPRSSGRAMFSPEIRISSCLKSVLEI